MQTNVESPNRLSSFREAASLTQAALGSQVGVTKQAISDFELGEKMPSLATAAALARVLGTTVDALFLGGESTSLLDNSRATASFSAPSGSLIEQEATAQATDPAKESL